MEVATIAMEEQPNIPPSLEEHTRELTIESYIRHPMQAFLWDEEIQCYLMVYGMVVVRVF